MKQLSTIVSLAILIGACGGRSQSTSPASPSVPAPRSAPQATYILSGVVFERTPTGTAPIENVEVYCDSCGSPNGHTFAYTDANGYYSFSYTPPGINPLLIRKDGYGDPAGQPPGSVPGHLSRQPIVDGDTHFDIELVRR